jgi:hypothetical protein
MFLSKRYYLKRIPDSKGAVFVCSGANAYYILDLMTEHYASDLNELLEEKISHSQFQIRLPKTAYFEYERIIIEFNRIIESGLVAETNSGILFEGEHFIFSIKKFNISF